MQEEKFVEPEEDAKKETVLWFTAHRILNTKEQNVWSAIIATITYERMLAKSTWIAKVRITLYRRIEP